MTETRPQIPYPVCAVVGDVLGHFYYSHNRLNTLFAEAGAPGEPPEGNCTDKCIRWLKRCNQDEHVDPFAVLGKALEHFMDVASHDNQQLAGTRKRVEDVLARHGLRYVSGGRILGAGATAPARTLKQLLADRDLTAVQIEFERALDDVETDPEASLTAACALIESICKVYIEERTLQRPARQTIKDLWKVVAGDLGLDPGSVEDDDLKRVLSGLASVVDGLGAVRTHAGSAHGRGRRRYKVSPRHARLVVHSASTLATFLIETWEARHPRRASGLTSA